MLSRCLILLSLLAAAPAAAEPILPEPQRISPRVWAWIGPYGGPSVDNDGFRMNLAFVVGDDAVAVLDTGYTAAMAREMVAAIRAVTPLPIRYAINTNSQAARHMGDAVMRDAGATLIAHRDARARITGEAQGFARAVERTLRLPADSVKPAAAPEQWLDDTRELDLGGATVVIRPVGHAHTPGSLVVHVPADAVVYSGDVLYSERLLAIMPGISDINGWLDAFAALRRYADATFIPGHGSVGPLSDFAHPVRDYLSALRDHMDAQVEAGTDMQSAIAAFDADPWTALENFADLHPRNAHAAYLQSEAAMFGP